MEGLTLDRPAAADVRDLHTIVSDPRVWLHFPSLRHETVDRTAAMVDRWIAQWERDDLGPWVVRDAGEVIGYGGCDLRRGMFWNLGYRLSADVHGRGIATRVARAAVDAARQRDASVPIVAYLVEHNLASARVAEKVGLSLVHRAPDAGNPDPSVNRLVYADRPLSSSELATALE